jgi:PAS domain S-box-containing protein/putative nucleotidyltransferase with HDIG domain
MSDRKFLPVDGISRVLGRTKIDSILLSFYHSAKPDYCFIGRLDREEVCNIQTLSILRKGKKIPNIIYPLDDSPCSLVVKKKIRVYKRFVQRYYPHDTHIQEWAIHGYVGYPILDDDKKPIGLYAAFYMDPIQDTESILNRMNLGITEIARELENHYRLHSLGFREKRFETLIRNSRDIILIIDKKGKLIYRAPSNYMILGIPGEKAVGLSIFSLIHPEDIQKTRKTLKDVIKYPGKVVNIQVRARHVSGSYKWIDGTLTNQLDEPAIRGIIVNYHDISDTKIIDEEVARNERRFRALIERSQDCISLIGADNKRLYYSPSITRVLGYLPEELLGTDSYDLTHPDDLEEMHRIGLELRQTPYKTMTYQFRARAKDNSWKWIEAIATNMLDNPDVGAIVINFKDISDRKYTEDKLRESERRFREFLETVNLAALLLDTEGRIEFINDYFLHISGSSREEIIGTSFFTRFLEPADKFRETFFNGINDGLIPRHFESPILTNSGSNRLIAWNTTILRDVAGVVTGIACLGEDITEFRKNEDRAKVQIQRVSALHAIDVVISSSFDSRIVFSVIVDQIMNQMGIDAVRILTYDPDDQILTYTADRGFKYTDQMIGKLNLGESHSGKAILDRQTIRYPESDSDAKTLPRIFKQERFVVGYSTPMTVKGQVKGVIEVYNRSSIETDPSWMDFLETMAGQAAIAIENNEMFDRLERTLADLTAAYDSTLEGWVRALDLRDKETIGHTQRVAMMVVRFALELGVSGDDLVNIRRGALLHDIGKMGIPDYILNKAGPLTDDERQIIEHHPQYAYELLQPIQYLRQSLDIPYAHHERWDGKGYPRGLKGEEIPLAARIFSVVDVWDALGSTRSYREKWDQKQMLDYLQEQSGKKFDPSIVKVFIDLLKRNLI